MIEDYQNYKKVVLTPHVREKKQLPMLNKQYMICQKLFFVNEHVTAILQTDTSDYRIGGMSYQIVNEIIQTITYISKALQGTCTVQ